MGWFKLILETVFTCIYLYGITLVMERHIWLCVVFVLWMVCFGVYIFLETKMRKENIETQMRKFKMRKGKCEK